MLSSHYKMTNLGEINSYLGVRITHNRSIKQLEIDQLSYITEIVDHFGIADSNPTITPLPASAGVHLIKYTVFKLEL
jgi:Reverse transcriptase (RNA-dependent DNA polymerase)